MILRISIVVILFGTLAFGQSASSKIADDWIRLESPSKDFSVSVPSIGFIVDNEDGAYRVYYYAKELSISITMESKSGAKGEFKNRLAYMRNADEYNFFGSGDFLVQERKKSAQTTKVGNTSLWQYFASSKGAYTISITAREGGQALFSRVARSIRLNGEAMYVGGETFPNEQTIMPISGLKTHAAVIHALNRPISHDLQLEKATEGEKDTLTDVEKANYSRDLVVLRRQRPGYTDAARRGNVQGAVTLRVTFLSDGTIGSIKLVESLDKGLDRNAFEAAKKIKFLPAEIDGKPVEVSRLVSFTFVIY